MQMINHHRLLNRMRAETQRQIAYRQRKITLKRIFDSCWSTGLKCHFFVRLNHHETITVILGLNRLAASASHEGL